MHKAAVSTHLQVVVGSLCSAFSDFQIAFWKAIKKITVFVSCAVLFEDVPHFGFKKGHIHIDGHHLWMKTTHENWHSTACGIWLSQRSLLLTFGNAVLRASASGELESQWKGFISLNWAAVVLWIPLLKWKRPMLTTPGKGKLFVGSMCPWGQLDWFALNWDYLTWRLICLSLQLMQMAPLPFNFMMVQNYPQARRHHFEFTIQTKPLTLPLWRGAVGCTAPSNPPLHSMGLHLFSCRKRSVKLLKVGTGFAWSSLRSFDSFIAHSSCSACPEIQSITESSQKLVSAEKERTEGINPFSRPDTKLAK